jgi:hypothetical protein
VKRAAQGTLLGFCEDISLKQESARSTRSTQRRPKMNEGEYYAGEFTDAVVMALVGHESAAMSQRYTHVGKESLNKSSSSIA